MNEQDGQQDMEKMKKTNTRLAVGVGVFGMGMVGLFYVLFFMTMLFKPGLFFSVMPVPTITSSAVSDGSRIWLLSQKPDMSNISPRENKPPKTNYFIAPLEGASPGKAIAVPEYSEVVGGDNKLVFLSMGSYRTYDGTHLTEVRTETIGRDPRGTLTPGGLYVISEFKDGSHLSRISDRAATVIPLPQEFLDAENRSPCPCAKIVWFRGMLCLFWPDGDSMVWTTWNGSKWAVPAVSHDFSGGYDVVADGTRLYFFNRQGTGEDRSLSYYVYENDNWSGPIDLPLTGGFLEWSVFLQQGKLKLLTQRFSHQTIFTVVNDRLEDPVRLGSPFNPLRMFGSMAFIVIGLNALLLVVIFGMSAVINRYKERLWSENADQYEFASVARRFLAYFIDNLLLLLPVACTIAFVFLYSDFSKNPAGSMLVVLLSVIFFFAGGFLYHSLLEGLLGWTVGKRICGIRVLRADFTPCGLSAGFLRNLMRIVDAFFYYLAGVVCVAATRKWQRLGDMIAETVVVRRSPQVRTEQ